MSSVKMKKDTARDKSESEMVSEQIDQRRTSTIGDDSGVQDDGKCSNGTRSILQGEVINLYSKETAIVEDAFSIPPEPGDILTNLARLSVNQQDETDRVGNGTSEKLLMRVQWSEEEKEEIMLQEDQRVVNKEELWRRFCRTIFLHF